MKGFLLCTEGQETEMQARKKTLGHYPLYPSQMSLKKKNPVVYLTYVSKGQDGSTNFYLHQV